MCHEIIGRGKNVSYIVINDLLVGAKSIMYRDGEWESGQNDYTYYVLGGGWFCEKPRLQDIVFDIPLVGGTMEVKSTCMAGMHIAPFTRCGKLNTYSKGNVVARIIMPSSTILVGMNDAPVLFFPEDIVLFDGEDISVKAFRFPTKSEAEKIAEMIFEGSDVTSYPMGDISTVLPESTCDNIQYRYGFPYRQNEEFFILIENE